MGTLKVNGAITATDHITSGNLRVANSGDIGTYLTTTGGWARGWYYTVNDTSMGGFGFYGSGSTKINSFYVGTYSSPWMSVTPAGTVTATTFSGSLSGNASTATKLKTARTISLTGSVTGSGTFDGSGNLSISTTTNHSHSYLPLSGGTMNNSAQIVRAGRSSSWYNGRDKAMIRQNTINGYSPIMSIKSTNGTWEMGCYDSASYLDRFILGYKADSEYDAGTPNSIIHAFNLTKEGNAIFSGSVTASSFSGTLAWSNISGKPSTFTPSSHSHSTLDSINSADVASSSTTQRYVFISYNDLTTNRPAYDTRLTFQTSTGTLSAPIFKGSLSGTASYATQADSVYGRYTGNGGNQVPSYIGANTTKFNMMRKFGNGDIGGYMDCILMNNYSWSDVPYATGLGITKVNGYPRAIIANGPKTGWAYTAELLTSYNYSWWAVPVSGGTMSGNLAINTNGNTMTIGSLNSAYCHIQSSADIPFYFNRRVFVDGCLGIYDMDSQGCGSSFPSSPTKGQIFFKI